MGQKSQPFGLRLGITEAHRSAGTRPRRSTGSCSSRTRRSGEYLDKRLNRTPPNAAVSDIHIERTREELKVIVRTARPGLVIGPKGAEVDRMTEELQYMTGRKVSISIVEIKNPDMTRSSSPRAWPSSSRSGGFRRVVKMRCENVMQRRRRGREDPDLRAPRGRRDEPALDNRLGSLPLSTLQANIDYGFAEAKTTYGVIGVKCWIYKGEYESRQEDETSPPRAPGACPWPARGITGNGIGRAMPPYKIPKRVKFRKEFRRVRDRKATKGNYVAFGDYGLQALEGCWLKSNCIEAGRIASSTMLKREGKIFIRVFPDKPCPRSRSRRGWARARRMWITGRRG